MIKRLVLEGKKQLICIGPGRIEIYSGSEERSADAYSGNILNIEREDKYRYYGTLDIQGSKFVHEPGLSGKKIMAKGSFGATELVFAVMKKCVNSSENDFWATWSKK